MISLTCTKCRATLSIDDAFAGGVCRCQHCGTIQTVPARAKGTGQSSGAIHQAATGGSSKSLYQTKKSAAAQPGSGLEELGEIIASSGLGSSRLRKPMKAAQESGDGAAAGRGLPVSPAVAGSIAAGVVGLVLVLWLVVGSGNGETAAPPAQGTGSSGDGSSAVAPAAAGPNFAGIPLEGDKVVYVLDRGSSSAESLGEVKEATLRSIASLGTERRFRIVFWETDGVKSFPPLEPATATKDNTDAARKAMDDIFAFGASDAKAAIESAVRNNPEEIVLVTAKGWDLNEDFVKMVTTALGGSKATVHTLSIGEPSGPLQAIAKATGGQSRALSISELRGAGK
jgi:hypothetical protein